MTPPPAESVAAMIRPSPVLKDSKVNRDLLRVMEGVSVGYFALLALSIGFMLAAGGVWIYQIYKGLDIASATPTQEERGGVPHHLIDAIEPTEPFTVHDWLRRCEAAITDIRARGGTPIVVGGTHLYIKALLDGLFEGPAPDPALREELQRISQPERRAELERVDPAAAERIHPADKRRTVRALEVYRQTGTPISDLQRQWENEDTRRKDTLLVGLHWETEAINRRINARVRAMMEEGEGGLLGEVRSLYEGGRLGDQAREALGVKQLLPVLDGGTPLEEAVERIKIETRRFAKNQRTWLRRLRATPGSVWIEAEGGDPAAWARQIAEILRGAR